MSHLEYLRGRYRISERTAARLRRGSDVWSPRAMRAPLASLVASVVLLAACSKKPEPAPAAPAGGAARTAAAPFSMRDLAFATALDAKLARFSLVASDVQRVLPAGTAAPATTPAGADAAPDRARMLLPRIDTALADVDQALAGISHPADRQQAVPARDAAKAYAGKLAAAAAGVPGAAPELLSARDTFAAAIGQYRASRARWRLDAPEPQGLERDFAEARREAEKLESALGSGTPVARREDGHALDPATARTMNGLEAARRASEIAERLPNPLRGPAVEYAAAQERALEAVTGLAQAPERERPALARRYHAAKVEALAALADYFAALSAR